MGTQYSGTHFLHASCEESCGSSWIVEVTSVEFARLQSAIADNLVEGGCHIHTLEMYVLNTNSTNLHVYGE